MRAGLGGTGGEPDTVRYCICFVYAARAGRWQDELCLLVSVMAHVHEMACATAGAWRCWSVLLLAKCASCDLRAAVTAECPRSRPDYTVRSVIDVGLAPPRGEQWVSLRVRHATYGSRTRRTRTRAIGIASRARGAGAAAPAARIYYSYTVRTSGKEFNYHQLVDPTLTESINPPLNKCSNT